jgi:hypothetical protein
MVLRNETDATVTLCYASTSIIRRRESNTLRTIICRHIRTIASDDDDECGISYHHCSNTTFEPFRQSQILYSMAHLIRDRGTIIDDVTRCLLGPPRGSNCPDFANDRYPSTFAALFREFLAYLFNLNICLFSLIFTYIAFRFQIREIGKNDTSYVTFIQTRKRNDSCKIVSCCIYLEFNPTI